MHLFRLFFFIFLLATLITVSILESHYVENTFDYLEDQLLAVEAMLEEDSENINSFENINAMDRLIKDWHIRANKLKFLVWHTGVKDVEIGLSRIKTYTTLNDFTEAKVELNNLLDFCRHFSKDFDVRFENIL